MQKATVSDIQRHALACYPRESCGVVIRLADTMAEKYLPAENEAEGDAGLDSFQIGADFMADAEDMGTVLAIIHSHPNGPDRPTQGDLAACNISGVPWYIQVVTRDDNGKPICGPLVGVAPDAPPAPLVGRDFHHGTLDCYGLIVDWFQRARGVELAHHERDDEWWKKAPELDLYMANLAADGWRVLPEGAELQTGDMIVMQIGSTVPNHAAVYVGGEAIPGYEEPFMRPGRMLHHLHGRKSNVDVYGGMWAHCTRAIARHQSQEK
jgi:cell wall-associated NlpC family hydrolase